MTRTRGGYLLLLVAIAILAVGVRLIAINQPFIDPWSWRQSDVAAIARNYSQKGFHFNYPQIDWSGATEGYVGTEFPILPYLAAICYRFVGVHEWIGRLESVIFFAISLPFFVALVRQSFDRRSAAWALAFYGLTPLSIMTSRCFMPDMPSLSLSIVGLFCFIRWLQIEKRLLFFAAAVAISLALLIKLPSAIIGVPLASVALDRFGRSTVRRGGLWLFGALVLVPSALWYWHAADIAYRFYPHHFFGEGGVRLMGLDWYWGIIRRIAAESLTAVPLVLAVTGVLFTRRTGRSSLFYWWLAAIIAFVVVVGYGNRHPWYQLPLIPVAAAFAGCAMARVWSLLRPRVWLNSAVAVVVVAVFAAQSYLATRTLYRPAAADLRLLGLALKERTPAGSLIVVADYGDPTAFYYAERKGWHFLEKDSIYNGHPSLDADAIADLDHLRGEGATHIGFYSGSVWWLDYYREFAEHLARTSVPVATTSQYQIFQLNR